MDWMNIALDEFHGRPEANVPVGRIVHPYGDNVSTQILASLESNIQNAFEKYMPDDDETTEKYEYHGLVPMMRSGQWGDEELGSFTLADLPDILNTLIVLEQKERERKQEERRKRKNARARVRRKLVKLGEW